MSKQVHKIIMDDEKDCKGNKEETMTENNGKGST